MPHQLPIGIVVAESDLASYRQIQARSRILFAGFLDGMRPIDSVALE
jgi:hypothetical protein